MDMPMKDSSDLAEISSAGGRNIVLEACTKIRKPDLRNILNFINFQDEDLIINFRHGKSGSPIALKAKPEPCMANTLRCNWDDRNRLKFNLSSYLFSSIFLKDGHNLIVLNSEAVSYDAEGISVEIPDFAYVSRFRHIARQSCSGVSARLVQNGALYNGELVDFSPAAFKVRIVRNSMQTFSWINPGQPVMLILEKEGLSLFSGDCSIIRHAPADNYSEMVVTAPLRDNLRRFPPKEYRSMRHSLNPPPSIMFTHPLSGKLVHLQSVDLSSSGLSVEELNATSSLVPGLIIPELVISIAGSHSITCVAQVLYRNIVNQDNGNSVVRSGIAFLDMPIQDQLTYSSLLHRVVDHRAQVGSSVDLDELWKLFFTSGFIYPEKYASIWPDKEEFKRTYRKLYLESPSIARHFMFQDRGRLYAHMSMIRFYGNSWIIHHHLGGKEQRGLAGVMVLDQVGFYVNEFHSLISTRMNFVICYYREENRFPDRVFGGVARNLDDPKASSLDTFAYLSIDREALTDTRCDEPSGPLSLFPAAEEDLIELEGFYEQRSGGLMLDALDLKAGSGSEEKCLNEEFEHLGFRRERSIYALKQNGELYALATVTVSDLGLNLSNLTNCIHVFLLEEIPYDRLAPVLEKLISGYSQKKVSVLIYPDQYVDNKISVYEKNYTLWILNLKNSDGYFQSLQKTFKRSQYDHGKQSDS